MSLFLADCRPSLVPCPSQWAHATLTQLCACPNGAVSHRPGAGQRAGHNTEGPGCRQALREGAHTSSLLPACDVSLLTPARVRCTWKRTRPSLALTKPSWCAHVGGDCCCAPWSQLALLLQINASCCDELQRCWLSDGAQGTTRSAGTCSDLTPDARDAQEELYGKPVELADRECVEQARATCLAKCRFLPCALLTSTHRRRGWMPYWRLR